MGNLAAAAQADWGAWGDAGLGLTPCSGCPKSGCFSWVQQWIRHSRASPTACLCAAFHTIACSFSGNSNCLLKLKTAASSCQDAPAKLCEWGCINNGGKMSRTWTSLFIGTVTATAKPGEFGLLCHLLKEKQSPLRYPQSSLLPEELWHVPACCAAKALVKRWSTTHTVQ